MADNGNPIDENQAISVMKVDFSKLSDSLDDALGNETATTRANTARNPELAKPGNDRTI